MNIKPLRNNVVVEKINNEKATTSGIVLTRSEEPDRARIVAVGDKVDYVQVGEVALVNWNKAVKIKDERYTISEDDIVFIYED